MRELLHLSCHIWLNSNANTIVLFTYRYYSVMLRITGLVLFFGVWGKLKGGPRGFSGVLNVGNRMKKQNI